MAVYALPALQPKQAELWSHVQQAKAGQRIMLGFGGSLFGGKTWMINWCVLQYATRYPGAKILVARQEERALVQSTLEKFKKLLSKMPPTLTVKSNKLEYELRLNHWPEGVVSTVVFSGLGNEDRFRSDEFTAIFIDEATDIEKSVVTVLLQRLRRPNHDDSLPVWLFMCASNPGPGWFEDWFINDGLGSKALEEMGVGKLRMVYSFMSDNKYADDGYEKFLRGTMSQADIATMVEGRWDTFAGQAVPNFDRRVHTWYREKGTAFGGKIKGWEKVIGGLDFGGAEDDAHYTAGLVRVVLPSGRDIVVSEFREAGSSVYQDLQHWMRMQQAKWGNGRQIQWKYDKTQFMAKFALRGPDGLAFNLTQNHGKPDSRLANVMEIRRRFDLHPVLGADKKPLKKDGEIIMAPLTWIHEDLVYLPEEIRKYRIDKEASSAQGRTIFVRKGDDLMSTLEYSTELLYTRRPDPYSAGHRLPVMRSQERKVWNGMPEHRIPA